MAGRPLTTLHVMRVPAAHLRDWQHIVRWSLLRELTIQRLDNDADCLLLLGRALRSAPNLTALSVSQYSFDNPAGKKLAEEARRLGPVPLPTLRTLKLHLDTPAAYSMLNLAAPAVRALDVFAALDAALEFAEKMPLTELKLRTFHGSIGDEAPKRVHAFAATLRGIAFDHFRPTPQEVFELASRCRLLESLESGVHAADHSLPRSLLLLAGSRLKDLRLWTDTGGVKLRGLHETECPEDKQSAELPALHTLHLANIGDERTLAGLRFPGLRTVELRGKVADAAHLLAAPALRDLALFGWTTDESVALAVAAFAPLLTSLRLGRFR
jgi:hypothetical protein